MDWESANPGGETVPVVKVSRGRPRPSAKHSMTLTERLERSARVQEGQEGPNSMRCRVEEHGSSTELLGRIG